MFGVPINVTSYFLASIATLVVGIRSTQNYRKIRSPLSRHFAISGFLASTGLFLYSVPFMIGLSGNELRAPLVIGRLCLDIVGYIQIYLIWYLTNLRKVRFIWVVIPTAVMAMIGYGLQVNYIYNVHLGIVDGRATTEFAPVAVYFHAVALLIVFCAGIILAKHAFAQNDTRGKVRLFSVALLYIAASASDFYGAIFLRGTYNSWVVLIGFVIASSGFLLSTLFVLKNTDSK